MKKRSEGCFLTAATRDLSVVSNLRTRLTGLPATDYGLRTTDYGLIRRNLCLAQNVETNVCRNEKVF